MKGMRGKEGQIFDLTDTEAYGMSACDSSIPFGRIVVQSEKYDGGCRLPDDDDLLGKGATTDANVPIGISIYGETFRGVNSGLKYPVGLEFDTNFKNEKESVSIGTKGRYYVIVENDTDPKVNRKVFYRTKTDTSDPLKSSLGSVRSGDDDGGNCKELKGSQFVLQSATAGNCAILSINMGAL